MSRFQWELMRERAQLGEESVPPAKECEALPLSAHFGAAMKGLHLGERMFVSRLGGAWGEIVGETLGRHTRPADLERGTLTVYVSHPGFLMGLRGKMTDEILARIGEKFPPPSPKVAKIRWQVQALPPQGT